MAHGYKVGDTVVPKIGPHKGHPHTVIHVHDSGEMNIKPKGLTGKQNKYRMGAATAKPEHLNPHTVAESTTCPDCGCESCRCKLKVDEAYTTMKGKESFMKKKPLDVKYDPRWHVMSHGKTMERPTKEEVEQKPTEKPKKKFDYKKFAEYRRTHPEKFIAGVKEEVELDESQLVSADPYKKQVIQRALFSPQIRKRKASMKSGLKKYWKAHKAFDTVLAAMKAKHTTKEEVEPIQELNRKTLQSYVGKATHDMAGKQMNLFSPDEHPNDAQKIKHRHAGIERAMKKLKEEVELDEASLKDACWKGYEAIGMKKKGGKKVPNCVPVNEQTPSGGFAGPDTAGAPSGGDVSTKTVSGADTTEKSSRKKDIIKRAVKSAQDKQKVKLGGKDKFESEPEAHPLIVTAHMP